MSFYYYLKHGYHDITPSETFGGLNLSEDINENGDLQVGNVASKQLTFTTSYASLEIGDVLEYRWKQTESHQSSNLKGFFTVSQIEDNNHGKYKITAYDDISKFDQIIDSWIESITFPITLGNMFSSLCTYVGCHSYSTTFTNSTMPIQDNFSVTNITGKQMLGWISAAAGGFAHTFCSGIGSYDFIKIDKYESLTSTKMTNSTYKSFDYASESTPKIDKVWVAISVDDVGVQSGSGSEVLKIINNPLFYTDSASAIQSYVNNIYSQVNGYPVYHKGTLNLLDEYFDNKFIECGTYITVKDNNAQDDVFLVMSKKKTQTGVVLQCYGNAHRSETKVPITSQMNQLRGKYSKLSNTVDGLEIEVGQKVGEDEIVTKINASAEAVTINTNKLNLTGYITATDVGSTGSTVIDGGRITTGSISSANGNYSVNLTDGTATLKSANITGGSINIETDSSSFDVIQLSHNNDKSRMSPSSISVQSLDDSRRTQMTDKSVIIYQINSDGQVTSTLTRVLEDGLYVKASGGTISSGLSATSTAITLKNTSGTTLTELNQNGVLCHNHTGTTSTVTFTSNNTWMYGSSLTLPAGYYILKAYAEVAENTAYCRFGVAIYDGSSNISTVQLGSDQAAVQGNTVAYKGTRIETTHFAYVSSNTTLQAGALSKGAGGGTGGSASIKLYAMRIG